MHLTALKFSFLIVRKIFSPLFYLGHAVTYLGHRATYLLGHRATWGLLGLFILHFLLVTIFNLTFATKPVAKFTAMSRVFGPRLFNAGGKNILMRCHAVRIPVYALESVVYLYGKYRHDRKYLIPWIVQVLYGFFAHQIVLLFSLLRDNIRKSNPSTAAFTTAVTLLMVGFLLAEFRLLKSTLSAKLMLKPKLPLCVDLRKMEQCMDLIERKRRLSKALLKYK